MEEIYSPNQWLFKQLSGLASTRTLVLDCTVGSMKENRPHKVTVLFNFKNSFLMYLDTELKAGDESARAMEVN